MKFSSIIVIALLFCIGCNSKSEYIKMEERELSKGIRHDSLFLGLKLGMTSKEFYSKCWELNKKGLVTDGSGNTAVLYKLNDLKYPGYINFYPEFYNDRIYSMPATFQYDGWAPWNRQLFSDSLHLDVVRLMEKWYGKGFVKITHSKKGDAYAKVDGNRRISIVKKDERLVNVVFTDLFVEKNLKRNN
jgi:hypothetical protein